MNSTTTRQNRPLPKGTIRLLAAGTTLVLVTSACALLAAPRPTSTKAPPASTTPTTRPRVLTTTPPTTTPAHVVAADGTCGARVAGYTYQRPFSDKAPWNVPVCNLPASPRSADWVTRFWDWSLGNTTPLAPESDPSRGDFGLMFGLVDQQNYLNDFSVAVYSAADATTTRHVRQKSDWNGSINIGVNDTIPWNPAWRASWGSDGLLVILDPTTGREWGLWGVSQPDPFSGFVNDTQCWGWNLSPYGYNAGTDLCVGGANLAMQPDGTPIDYRTYQGNFDDRGSKIQEYAMVTTPAEVAAGEIRHALMMPVYNAIFGPACPISTQPTDVAFGTTCGAGVAPAGGLENLSAQSGGGQHVPAGLSLDDMRARSVPEGTRFALHITDAEIDSWLTSRGYTGQKRATARVFAVAMRDYGWMATDTSGWAASFQLSGGANPDTAQAWRGLGIDNDGTDLLYGLFTKARLWTVEPPTNYCASGPTQQGCITGRSEYP